MARGRTYTLTDRHTGEQLTVMGRNAARAMQRAHPGRYRSSEYDIRTEPARRGLVPLAKARGHAARPEPYDPQLEAVVKDIRSGKSLSQATRHNHVSQEKARAYLRQTGVVEKERGRWVVTVDFRGRELSIFTQGREITITVPDYKAARFIGQYMSAVGHFTRTGDVSLLEPFQGKSVMDDKGHRYPLETRPNVLFRLTSVQTETFHEIYRIVA